MFVSFKPFEALSDCPDELLLSMPGNKNFSDLKARDRAKGWWQ